MSPKLLAFLKPTRREVYAKDKAKAFLAAYTFRKRKRIVAAWRFGYMARRKRARLLVAQACVRWRLLNTLDGFAAWRFGTLRIMNAITIQRYSRGWMGRLALWYLERMELMAVTLQTGARRARCQSWHAS